MMAVDVLNPVSKDTVNEAPMARPSMKLCSASLSVIIHATVLMLETRRPRNQWHIRSEPGASWKRWRTGSGHTTHAAVGLYHLKMNLSLISAGETMYL